MRDRIRETLEGAQFGVNGQQVLAALLVLTVIASGVSAAQSLAVVDDFDDGNLSEYSGDLASFSTVQSPSVSGSALEATSTGTQRIFSQSGLGAYPGRGDTVSYRARIVNGTLGQRFLFGVESTTAYYSVGVDPDGLFISERDGGIVTTISSTNAEIPTDEWLYVVLEWGDSGNMVSTVYDAQGNRVATVSGSDTSYTNGGVGFAKASGDVTVQWDSVRIVEDGYVPERATVPENASLTLKHNNYMKYGETQPYVVVYENDTGSHNVTSEASVWSNNTSVVAFDQSAYSMTATNNTNVSARVTTHANYTLANGIVINDTSYVTVANATVENLEILPPIYRFSATIGDDTIFFLIIAMLASVVATRFTTAFGGICVYEIVVLMGWFSGWIQFGIMLLVTMTSIFIGLNLAANINYGTMGGMAGRMR